MTRPVPQKPFAEKDVISLPEAADYLGVSDETMRGLLAKGKIPGGRLFRRWRVRKADLDLYIRHNKNPLVAEAEEKAKAEITPSGTNSNQTPLNAWHWRDTRERRVSPGIGDWPGGVRCLSTMKVQRASPPRWSNIANSIDANSLTSPGCMRFPSARRKKPCVI